MLGYLNAVEMLDISYHEKSSIPDQSFVQWADDICGSQIHSLKELNVVGEDGFL
jgi:hypothetical protein